MNNQKSEHSQVISDDHMTINMSSDPKPSVYSGLIETLFITVNNSVATLKLENNTRLFTFDYSGSGIQRQAMLDTLELVVAHRKFVDLGVSGLIIQSVKIHASYP